MSIDYVTEDDIRTLWPQAVTYLADILNGEYSVSAAGEDLRGLIGSKFDPRVKINPANEAPP